MRIPYGPHSVPAESATIDRRNGAGRQPMSEPKPRKPHGGLGCLAVVIGSVMLLPGIPAGLCVFAAFNSPNVRPDDWLGFWAPFLVPCFAISALGLVLIFTFARRPRG